MEPAHSIGRLGFRKWYERQLIEAHAWLVTSLLIGIAIAVTLEGISFRKPFYEWAPFVGLLFVGGLIVWHGMRRFGTLMEEANRLAEHSTCEACGAYGRFHVEDEYPSRMKVRCRRCSHLWMLG
jgi:predicted Zn finger-like uncharacterized protein